MTPQLLSLAAGLMMFFSYGIIYLTVMRFTPRARWFNIQVILAVAVHLITALSCWYLLSGFRYWYALGVFSVGWFGFFTLSTAIYVSISARILRTIGRQPTLSLALDDIFRICIREPFKERADFLVASGLAQKGQIGYRITEQGARNASRVRLMRTLFGMQGSGLYGLSDSSHTQSRDKP